MFNTVSACAGISRVAAVLAWAAFCLLTAMDAQAENECGSPEGEVVCSSSTYDPAAGSIFYSFDENGADETSGDFSILLTGDLSISYDRERPGDDEWVSPEDHNFRFHSAVTITPGEFGEYTGDISLYSSADVTANARGIYAGHYGKSGALRMEIEGGEITTTGPFAAAVSGLKGNDAALDLIIRDAIIDSIGEHAYGVLARHSGEGDLNLTAEGLNIKSAGLGASGIVGTHSGEGGLNLALQDLGIETAGDMARGVHGSFSGAGKLRIDARNLDIATKGRNSYGVIGDHVGEGELNVTAQGGSIVTADEYAMGIIAAHRGVGDVSLATSNIAVTTAGDHANNVYAEQRGTGDVNITAEDLDLKSTGLQASGIVGYHFGEGDLNLVAREIDFTTAGRSSFGIYFDHRGKGGVNLALQDLGIETAGDRADGVYGSVSGAGKLRIDARNLDIATKGRNSYGLSGFLLEGELNITAQDVSIATIGWGADGVVGALAGPGSAHIMVEGGSVRAAGERASGVGVGVLAENGDVAIAALVGEDGYRKQSVEVNAPVTGGSGENAAGVLLAGGGKVTIGPKGSVSAASGIGILASGGLPRLRVEMQLDGRLVAEAIGENWIINDEGETTLVVNGVTLHEGAEGAADAEAMNGAWDIALRASENVTGRGFSAQDFIETYAPRAAVYEALPGFLLRIDDGRPSGRRVAQSGSALWARTSGGRGSYEPRRAHVGAEYDFRRFTAEAGLDHSLYGNITGSFSLRHLQGSGDVGSPSGGGEIDAKGTGVAVGLSWSGAGAYYARGRFSFMAYDVDVTSRKRGGLARDIDANGRYMGVDAGRRIAYGEKVTLTPRAWAAGRSLSGGFTDALGSRVSLTGITRYTGGVGLSAETARTLGGGVLTVFASADVEHALRSAETRVSVSGKTLESEAAKTRVLLGLGGSYRKERFAIRAQMATGGPGSGDREYSGRVELSWRF